MSASMLGFHFETADLVRNTSGVVGATVRDALNALNAVSPGTVLTTLGDLLSFNTAPTRIAVGAANTFLGSTGAAVPSWRTAAEVYASLGVTSAWQTILAQTTPISSYTPTLYNTTNVDASTAYTTYYLQVGTVVLAWGLVDINATAASGTFTQLGMSIPVASNFAAVGELGGVFNGGGTLAAGRIAASVANDRAEFFMAAQLTANASYGFMFAYKVI